MLLSQHFKFMTVFKQNTASADVLNVLHITHYAILRTVAAYLQFIANYTTDTARC